MSQDHWFACPHCAMRYNWQPAHAGRKVRCRCASMLRIPDAPGQPALLLEPASTPATAAPVKHQAVEGFALELESDNPSKAHRPCPQCGKLLATHAVLCTDCGLRLNEDTSAASTSTGQSSSVVAQLVEETASSPESLSRSHEVAQSALKQIESRYAYDREVEVEASTAAWVVDVILPIVLTLAGFFLLGLELFFYDALAFATLDSPRLARAMMHGVNILVGFVFLYLGILLVARLFGNAPGTLGTLLLKLTAIAVFCVAMDAMVHWGLDVITEGFAQLGGYLKLIASGIVFFCVAGLLLGLDILELVVLFIFTRLVPMMAIMFLAAIIYSLFE